VTDNVGKAGDSELMSLNATSRIIVSVPADTKIYVVFTKHEESQTGLHRVAGNRPTLSAFIAPASEPGILCL